MIDQGGPFRNWKAVLNLQPIVAAEPLRVRGEYNLNKRCGGVRLQKGVQGINERILILDIVAEDDGDGGWETVEGRFEAEEGQYDRVDVHGLDGERTTVEIEVVH